MPNDVHDREIPRRKVLENHARRGTGQHLALDQARRDQRLEAAADYLDFLIERQRGHSHGSRGRHEDPQRTAWRFWNRVKA